MLERLLDTPVGPARARIHAAEAPRAGLVLGHGAGRGTDTADLQHLAAALPAHGVSVVLVDQPWVLAGRRVAAPARTLDSAWTSVLSALRREGEVPVPWVAGGRSTGGRVACRTAVVTEVDALLLLAFPLRPPARDPARRSAAVAIRVGEVAAAGAIPIVAAQGERDPFGTPLLLAEQVPTLHVVPVPGADHALRVRQGDDVVAEALVTAALRAVELAGAG